MENKVIKRIYTYHLSLANGNIVKYTGEGLFHNIVDGDTTTAVLINSAVITHIEEILEDKTEKLVVQTEEECEEIDPKKMTQDERNAYYESLLSDEEKEERTKRKLFLDDSNKKIAEFCEEIKKLQRDYINTQNPSVDYIKACNDENSWSPYDIYSIETLIPYCFKHGVELSSSGCSHYECHMAYQLLSMEDKWKWTKYGKIPPFLDKSIKEIPLPAKSKFRRKKTK